MNLESIEPLGKLGIKLVRCDAITATFSVPLSGNRNDKGTVFAGSQYNGLVLAGWYLASVWANENGHGDKVAIKDCHVTYPAPASSDLTVEASFKDEPDQRPSGHLRAKISVKALNAKGEVTATLDGDYRILKK